MFGLPVVVLCLGRGVAGLVLCWRETSGGQNEKISFFRLVFVGGCLLFMLEFGVDPPQSQLDS